MLTIETIRAHCRIDGTADDALLLMRAKAVEAMAEQETGRTITRRDRTRVLRAWGSSGGVSNEIPLAGVPVVEVKSVTYLDGAGVRQTMDPAGYKLCAGELDAMLWAPNGWPAAKDEPGSIVITYTAGYGAAETDIPEALRAWMLLHIAHLTRNAEATSDKPLTPLPFAAGLLDPLRVYA